MSISKDDFKEFLLEEYIAFTDSLHKSEQSGEARLTFFQTLSTAILGIVTLLLPKAFSLDTLPGNINNKLTHNIELVHIVIFVLLLSILAIGVVIQNRLKRRNLITTQLIEGIKHIRDVYKRGFAINPEIANNYDPAPKLPKRRFTSLSDIAGIINIVVTAITVIVFTYSLTPNLITSSIAGAAAIIAAIMIFFRSSLFKKSKKAEDGK